MEDDETSEVDTTTLVRDLTWIPATGNADGNLVPVPAALRRSLYSRAETLYSHINHERLRRLEAIDPCARGSNEQIADAAVIPLVNALATTDAPTVRFAAQAIKCGAIVLPRSAWWSLHLTKMLQAIPGREASANPSRIAYLVNQTLDTYAINGVKAEGLPLDTELQRISRRILTSAVLVLLRADMDDLPQACDAPQTTRPT